MNKHTYNIVCEERYEDYSRKQIHCIKIEAVSFDECIKKYKENYSWEIIEVVRL